MQLIRQLLQFPILKITQDILVFLTIMTNTITIRIDQSNLSLFQNADSLFVEFESKFLLDCLIKLV